MTFKCIALNIIVMMVSFGEIIEMGICNHVKAIMLHEYNNDGRKVI
jgi:hypothetical protein